MPGASSGHTREHHAGRASPALASRIALLFDLAPGGVYRADPVTRAAGELLPHRFTLTAREGGGLLSVALSMGSPPLAVSQHPALRSSDFPPAANTLCVTAGDHLGLSVERAHYEYHAHAALGSAVL